MLHKAGHFIALDDFGTVTRRYGHQIATFLHLKRIRQMTFEGRHAGT
jgi:hypothetical protein